MNQRILVAFDASENAHRAVDYVADLVRCGANFHVELLHVERLPERDFFATDVAWKEACIAHAEEVRTALAAAKHRLLAAGLGQEAVGESVLPVGRGPEEGACGASLGTGIARVIMCVRESGGYSTVVIGRRGVSKAEEFLFGSVSSKVMHLAKDCAVWVVA